ncbi:MAG: Septum formation initiator [Verrucomicrobiales bacterium]|jgi:cell division protein FtsB|nr:Septum formation initiator [Verrucomicrobiales bacterium]
MNIWEKLTRLVVILLFLASLVGVILWYSPVIQKNERMRKELMEYDRRIEKEMDQSKKLEASIRSMQEPRTIERLARERLHYAKTGETVLYFETVSTNISARTSNR